MEDAKLHELVSNLKKLFKDLGHVPTREEFIVNGASDWSIRMAGGYEKLKFLAGLEGLEEENLEETTTYEPKILLIDIEVSPILAYVFDLYDQNIGLNQIVEDWHVMSWSAKWLGEKELMYMDNRNSIGNDKKIVKEIWKLMDEADFVVGQNSKRFDEKKLNAKFFEYKLGPVSSYRSIDTLLISKRKMKFTSHKLEYITSKFNNKYKKLKHDKYPGMELWTECLKGNMDAWREMEKYNKYDVLALEEYYLNLRKWDDTVNWGIFKGLGMAKKCICGSVSFIKQGFKWTNTGKFQRFRCKECSREFVDKQNLLSKEKKQEAKRFFG